MGRAGGLRDSLRGLLAHHYPELARNLVSGVKVLAEEAVDEPEYLYKRKSFFHLPARWHQRNLQVRDRSGGHKGVKATYWRLQPLTKANFSRCWVVHPSEATVANCYNPEAHSLICQIKPDRAWVKRKSMKLRGLQLNERELVTSLMMSHQVMATFHEHCGGNRRATSSHLHWGIPGVVYSAPFAGRFRRDGALLCLPSSAINYWAWALASRIPFTLR